MTEVKGGVLAVPFGPGGKSDRRIGVVFVHGVGEQKQSSTIREQGGPLLEWIWSWLTARGLAGDVVLRPQSATLSYGATLEGPARFSVHLPAYDREPYEWERAGLEPGQAAGSKHWDAATWVLAEGWWATRLEAPSMVTMLAWTLRILRRFWIGLYDESIRRMKERFGHRAADGDRFGQFWERIGNILLVGVEIPLALLSYPLVAFLLLLAQIPIDRVQKFIVLTLIRPLVVDRVGDFWIYLHDYPGAMHIRRGVEEVIDWLAVHEHCDEFVVVAHSQGAVVAFDALTSGGIKHINLVRRFITIGAALNKAWTLEEGREVLDGVLPSTLERWVDLWANYDPVPGGPLKAEIAARFPIYGYMRLTNGINVLTDHDTYWKNPEEFLSRIVQEIDAPDAHGSKEDPTSSRFWPGKERQDLLVHRRADRVHALVFWRCVAFFVFLGAIVARASVGSAAWGSRLAIDGRGVWAAVHAVPGANALITPLEAVGAWVDRILSNVGLSFEPVGMAITAVVGFAAIVELTYLLGQALLYTPWDKWQTDEVPQPPNRVSSRATGGWWRTPAGAVLVALPALAIAGWP